LAFLGATFILVRIRSQRLEKEKRALEKMVEERTSEIQEQKEEIQSQSDSLYIKNKELEKINQMVASINTGISFSAVMGHIIEEIRFIRDVERAASLVLDEATQRFVVRSHHGWEEQQAAEVSLTEAEAEALLLQRSAKVGEDLYYVADGYHSSAIEQHPAFGGAKTSLVLIIRVEDQTRGYLVLECLSKANAFGPQDFDLMASFKEHVVSAFIKSKIMNELQQTFENLQQTQAKLVSQEKMAGLGQLTAGIAHEINNPINFISGNVKPLRRDLDDLKEILEKYAEIEPDSDLEELLEEVEELKEDLDYDFVLDEIDSLINDIENGATRTAEIVKDLRNFSRLDEANLKKASIEDGLDSTLSILKNKYKERIEVVRHYAPLEPIECYAGKLNQVFMNILNNAIQATPDKGTITLTTIDKGEMVEVRLKDTGAGMTEETQKKLFDPFYTTKDVGEGTGLGMSISFGVINDHSGTIEFESELGVGTEFIITLPKKQPKKEEA
ncbi:MAG: ATP-binding protein, partial [Salibacteraceae bacterium]